VIRPTRPKTFFLRRLAFTLKPSKPKQADTQELLLKRRTPWATTQAWENTERFQVKKIKKSKRRRGRRKNTHNTHTHTH
jgi:hypothetical protein